MIRLKTYSRLNVILSKSFVLLTMLMQVLEKDAFSSLSLASNYFFPREYMKLQDKGTWMQPFVSTGKMSDVIFTNSALQSTKYTHVYHHSHLGCSLALPI